MGELLKTLLTHWPTKVGNCYQMLSHPKKWVSETMNKSKGDKKQIYGDYTCFQSNLWYQKQNFQEHSASMYSFNTQLFVSGSKRDRTLWTDMFCFCIFSLSVWTLAKSKRQYSQLWMNAQPESIITLEDTHSKRDVWRKSSSLVHWQEDVNLLWQPGR